jgi:RNA polymerase sigma-70 factor (ECF subfamily)
MDTRAIIEGVLAEHRPAMIAFVRRRAGHLVDPEDVLQQAIVRALSKSAQLRDTTVAKAWVYRILRNVLADELRTIGVPAANVETEELSDSTILENDDRQTCRCALELSKKLKPEYAAILERVVIDEAPVTSIAAELGLTANNATVRLHRARKALRTLLAKHCGAETLRACLECVCSERGTCAAL